MGAEKFKFSDEVRQKAAKIKLLLMDVDGVLTNGLIYWTPAADGQMVEFKGFDSQDGLGFHMLHDQGIKSGVISGRNSPSVDERAKNLNMTYVYQGHLEKVGVYEKILKDAGVTPDQVAYIGDDFTDVPLMRLSGLACAVSNARPEVARAANYQTSVPGGAGAVREVIELILYSQGFWEKIVKKYQLD
jgi:3-deoxy-D-manno-octulosonate 8-phosphate phosphatase (KDO 8-P phosphatase)